MQQSETRRMKSNSGLRTLGHSLGCLFLLAGCASHRGTAYVFNPTRQGYQAQCGKASVTVNPGTVASLPISGARILTFVCASGVQTDNDQLSLPPTGQEFVAVIKGKGRLAVADCSEMYGGSTPIRLPGTSPREVIHNHTAIAVDKEQSWAELPKSGWTVLAPSAPLPESLKEFNRNTQAVYRVLQPPEDLAPGDSPLRYFVADNELSLQTGIPIEKLNAPRRPVEQPVYQPPAPADPRPAEDRANAQENF